MINRLIEKSMIEGVHKELAKSSWYLINPKTLKIGHCLVKTANYEMDRAHSF